MRSSGRLPLARVARRGGARRVDDPGPQVARPAGAAGHPGAWPPAGQSAVRPPRTPASRTPSSSPRSAARAIGRRPPPKPRLDSKMLTKCYRARRTQRLSDDMKTASPRRCRMVAARASVWKDAAPLRCRWPAPRNGPNFHSERGQQERLVLAERAIPLKGRRRPVPRFYATATAKYSEIELTLRGYLGALGRFTIGRR